MQEGSEMEDQKATDKRKAPDKGSTENLSDESLVQQTPKRARLETTGRGAFPILTSSENPFGPETEPLQDENTKLLSKDNVAEDAILLAIAPTSAPQEIILQDLAQVENEATLPLENGNKVESESVGVDDEARESQTGGNFFDEVAESENRYTRKTDVNLNEDNNNDNKLNVENPTTVKSDSKPTGSSSPPSNSENPASVQSNELEIHMKVIDTKQQKIIYEDICFKSDYSRLDEIMKNHNLSGIQNSINSGYLGDVDSEQFSYPQTAALYSLSQISNRKNRWTSSTLGSSIPRTSIKTIISLSPTESLSQDVSDAELAEVKKKRGRHEPLLTSTILMKNDISTMSIDYSTSSTDSKLGSSDASISINGSDAYASPKFLKKKVKKSSSSRTPSTDNSKSSSKRASEKETPEKTDKVSDNGKKKVGRKPSTTSREFASVSSIDVIIPTPPAPARIVAKVEGTVAKPLTTFEQDVNNEPVVLSQLQHSQTLWGAIAPGNEVFARWRDKNYYSGLVKSKGMNDTWIINYDDGMEDVASETHIVPIKILGVNTVGVYTPDAYFKPSDATILGQKFVYDKKANEDLVKYAIQLAGESNPIWCTRRQLSIKEADARTLRQEFMPTPKVLKAAEVSLENIVSGSRRRATPGSSSQTPAAAPIPVSKPKPRRILGGAFDESTAEDSSSESKSTKRKGGKGNRKTSESSSSEVSKLKTTGEDGEKIEKSSPVKDSPKKEKTKQSKLFDGYQFFLTASGGGDPAAPTSESSTPAVPYDKDEFRSIIEENDGKVIDLVGKEIGKDNVFLISDNYARTVKYIYCLAGGIPCVSHKWIQKCIIDKMIVNWKQYELNAGWSLEEDRIITRHRLKPLKGFEIYITAGTEDLYNYWRPVLMAAQAKLLKPKKVKGKINDDIPPSAQVLVTDATCSKVVLTKAHDKMLPVVKPEWLVQSIISGKKADFFNHDKYRVEMNENEEDQSYEDEEEESGEEMEEGM